MAEEIAALFTRADGSFRFARWGCTPAPVVFGTDDATLVPMRAAMEEVAGHAGLALAETDPELGSNFIVFFCAHWADLSDVPHLERLLPELGGLISRLEAAGANQYRHFRFSGGGAIRACILLLRQDEHLAAVPAHTLMLSQTVQSLLLWSDTAFRETSALHILGEGRVAAVKPGCAALLRAAYDPALPDASADRATALRLAARIGLRLS
ncbi:hypothetical protein FDP22_09940 [Paroceanicella profunda]|uniref:Uncharacterized protein n=1 Tax=Paroceanicella profunda TaxID=2579971 RepID=A0A5B8FJ01_9RHOB|nr:hypothetical protein FDP22_09940 [Paroceanicella profunda]